MYRVWGNSLMDSKETWVETWWKFKNFQNIMNKLIHPIDRRIEEEHYPKTTPEESEEGCV